MRAAMDHMDAAVAAMEEVTIMAKARVSAYTRSDGTFVAEHDDKRASAAPKHKQMVDAATYSGGQHEEHDATTSDRHASRSIRVGTDRQKAHEHAHDTLVGAGMKPSGTDIITGAHKYDSDTHTAEIMHNNGVMHVAVKKKPAQQSGATSQNIQAGFHGEAVRSHIRANHGPDTDEASLGADDRKAAHAHAAEAFSRAASHLVDAGHFKSHDEAREFLDSTHGRHLHDGASMHGGDVSKVRWLGSEVGRFKLSKSGGGNPGGFKQR